MQDLEKNQNDLDNNYVHIQFSKRISEVDNMSEHICISLKFNFE